MKNKAIDTMISGLKEPLTDLEKSSAFIYIGQLYVDLKEYNKASEYFHKGLKIVEHQEFYFSPNFSKIIKIFIKNEELEKATYWLENFKRRIPFDKKFSKTR
ncbi:tetratricopeptide repeat protein [Lysinibacillus sphaericus]|uniref:tetratricopeptide repeat protein n=1 Tax=Lysinibacillus sphaericus TaxID=1421 RepID=UPI001943FC40|nr:tetratricopeptide repeat protein [Lysinibacillus sphaericus]